MDIRFDDKVALVTGAASGIGEAIALELGRSGATVIVADLKDEDAQPVVTRITDAGGKAAAIACDVTDAKAVEAAMETIKADHGGLHLLVNNAGIGGAAAKTGDYPVDSWNAVIGVNLTGVFHGLRFGLPLIAASGGGAVVNMASILGSVGIAQSPAYVAAKHGVVGLTKSAAIEYAKEGIRINSVGPAFIDTPLLQQMEDDARAGLAEAHPVGRLGKAEEVATLVAFLLSDQASFITGSYHLVDGAYTAQ